VPPTLWPCSSMATSHKRTTASRRRRSLTAQRTRRLVPGGRAWLSGGAPNLRMAGKKSGADPESNPRPLECHPRLTLDCLPQGTAPQRHEGRCSRRFRLEMVREAVAAVPEVALGDDNVIASMRMAVSVAKSWVVSVWLASPRLMEQLKETVV